MLRSRWAKAHSEAASSTGRRAAKPFQGIWVQGMKRTRWFKAKEIKAAIEVGEILDAKTMLGYFFWKRSRGIE
jgi:hypothetical protein